MISHNVTTAEWEPGAPNFLENVYYPEVLLNLESLIGDIVDGRGWPDSDAAPLERYEFKAACFSSDNALQEFLNIILVAANTRSILTSHARLLLDYRAQYSELDVLLIIGDMLKGLSEINDSTTYVVGLVYEAVESLAIKEEWESKASAHTAVNLFTCLYENNYGGGVNGSIQDAVLISVCNFAASLWELYRLCGVESTLQNSAE